MKKKILLAGAVALMAAAVVTGFSAYNKTNVLNVLSANVEALANDESHTTWACDGSSKTRCEVCGTSVSGRGRLTGSHKCS